MGSYLLHEAVAAGVFNRDHNTASGAFTAWPNELQNTPELLKLLCERMLRDYETCHAKMRKPYSLKDVASWLATFSKV